MRPPICAVCYKRFSNGGGLVRFVLTEEEQKRAEKFKQPGYVGHPPGLEWFCDEHWQAAKDLSNLTKTEALKQLRLKFPQKIKK